MQQLRGKKLTDILHQQIERAVSFFKPISNKILGAVEGNHEQTIKRYYNENVQRALCRRLGIEDLTDEALIRLRFAMRNKATKRGMAKVLIVYIRHGYGSGRSPGAEPTKLSRMLDEWETADICLTGHTHVYHILPPKPVLYIPKAGKLPEELLCRYRWAANWGCWQLSHAVGPSTYASRACYPARPLFTVKITITPFWHTTSHGQDIAMPKIEILQTPIG